jgi:hypothetical protein
VAIEAVGLEDRPNVLFEGDRFRSGRAPDDEEQADCNEETAAHGMGS